jgi:hypothetical protein
VPTGSLPVTVSANLPGRLAGVAALGVTLRVAPRPPMRPRAEVRTVELPPPAFLAETYLALSPAEPPEYTFSAFVITEHAQGAAQLQGPERPHQGGRINLAPEDFPAVFLPIEASQSLLELCTLTGAVHYNEAGDLREVPFELARDGPALCLALPGETREAWIELCALPAAGQQIAIGPLPARPALIGLHSFAEYGPHTIRVAIDPISLENETTPALVAVELWPAGLPEAPESISVVVLTPAQPEKTWTYLAESPFQAGYRYRLAPAPGQALPAWSEVRSPFEDLVIAVSGDSDDDRL